MVIIRLTLFLYPHSLALYGENFDRKMLYTGDRNDEPKCGGSEIDAVLMVVLCVSLRFLLRSLKLKAEDKVLQHILMIKMENYSREVK